MLKSFTICDDLVGFHEIETRSALTAADAVCGYALANYAVDTLPALVIEDCTRLGFHPNVIHRMRPALGIGRRQRIWAFNIIVEENLEETVYVY